MALSIFKQGSSQGSLKTLGVEVEALSEGLFVLVGYL